MIYFTSDLHLWHNNIIKFCNRPFSSVEEMNEILIKNWNDVVQPDDIVYCIGDFSMAFRPVETITCRLMGKKFLIPGNHDHVHSYNKRGRNIVNRQKWIDKYIEHGWTVLPEQTTLDLPGIGVVNVCHLPYKLDTPCDDKFEKWRLVDDGKWLICGHVHDKWKQVGKMINVGVDQWNFKLVPITEIEKMICTYNTI